MHTQLFSNLTVNNIYFPRSTFPKPPRETWGRFDLHIYLDFLESTRRSNYIQQHQLSGASVGIEMSGSAGDGSRTAVIPGKAITEPRDAPAERPSASWTRRLIIFAFWAVVATLGLPHWIWTTSIHRSELPLKSMNAWADGKACQIHYPLNIRIAEDDSQAKQTQALARDVAGILDTQNSFPLFRLNVTAEAIDEPALVVNVQTDSKAKSTASSLRPWEPVLDITHNTARSVDKTTLPLFVANEIGNIFKTEKDTMAYLTEGTSFEPSERQYQMHPATRAELDGRATRAFRYATSYHLTFSLFTSAASPSTWEIEKALDEYIRPLLNRMSSISQFTIDTQVQLFASCSPSIAGPHFDETTRVWKLERNDLSGFINAAEWPLSPSIGAGPTINFVLYVPSAEQSPLVLAETGGNSWLIPQWGGVQLLNHSSKQSDTLTAQELRPVMLKFAEQLSSLLGLPAAPQSLALRISSLARDRTASLIMSASSTLGALAKLSLKLESIAIPDSVAKSVDETIHRLDQACRDLKEGRYQTALENARVAESEAEQAFFEPSMVGQVYFPDEHKVAVYVPLLGPMAVPLVMALLKEVRKLKDRRKTKIA